MINFGFVDEECDEYIFFFFGFEDLLVFYHLKIWFEQINENLHVFRSAGPK